MTEVTTYQQNTPVAMQNGFEQPSSQAMVPAPTQAIVSLAEWASEAQAIQGLAEGLSRTDFVPKEFRGSAGNVTAVILKGKSLGLDPMQSLEMFYVVHGRVGMYSKAMLQLVIRAGHSLVAVERTEQQVTVRARRRGETEYVDYTWSITRATKAGYANKDKYKTNPMEMLHWKAIAEACKFTFPDVIGGLTSVEDLELGDYEGTPAPAPAGAKAVTAGSKRVQRKTTPKAPATPTAPPAPPAPPVIEDDPEDEGGVDTETGELPAETPAEEIKYISKADQARISAGLEELGITDRTVKLEQVRYWMGLEELRGVNGLTHDQGQHVLAEIERTKVLNSEQ